MSVLKENYNRLLETGKWLRSNSSSSTKQELNDYINAKNVTGITTDAQKNELWDSLLLYTLRNQKPYVRDGIISILKANHVLAKLGDINAKFSDQNSKVSDYLNAIVLIPKEFQPVPLTTKKMTAPRPNMKVGAITSLRLNRTVIETLKTEVADYKKRVGRINKKAKTAYDQGYEKDVNAAYEKAEKIERVVTDPETNETSVVVEYKGLDLPSYDFQPIDTIVSDYAKSGSSDYFSGLLPAIMQNESLESVDEIEGFLDDKGNELDRDKADLIGGPDDGNSPGGSNSQEVVDGMAQICFSRIIGTDNRGVTIALDKNFDNLSISNASYTFQGDSVNDLSGNSADAISPANPMTVMLGSNQLIPISQYNRFYGELVFSNGSRLQWDLDFDFKDIASSPCSIVDVDIEYADGSGNDGDPGDLVTPPLPDQKPVLDYGIKRLGIADYRKVEQEICCYVPGEVSHIENIMAREFKQKTSRRLRRREDIETSKTETESEILNETTTADRFEMNQEMASMTAQDQAFNASAGLQYSGMNGKLVTSANANYANASSQEESNAQAVSHAKEMTERALERVVEKVTNERVTKIVEEFEETTDHGYDNRKGDSHISGVYRWVDKIYNNKVVNYGKRLIYEFMIPEPASLHKVLTSDVMGDIDTSTLIKPIDPRTHSTQTLANSNNLNKTLAEYWASYYNVEIEPQPALNVSVSEAFNEMDKRFNGSDAKKTQFIDIKGEINLPEGYRAKKADYSLSFYGQGFGGERHVVLSMGNSMYVRRDASFNLGSESVDFILSKKGTLTFELTHHISQDPLKYSLMCAEGAIASASFFVECELTEQAEQKWKYETFKAIIDG